MSSAEGAVPFGGRVRSRPSNRRRGRNGQGILWRTPHAFGWTLQSLDGSSETVALFDEKGDDVIGRHNRLSYIRSEASRPYPLAALERLHESVRKENE
jgi:hypothetical protein